MKVLVIGNGGREHALIWKISQSDLVNKIYCSSRNAGIEELAECQNIKSDDIKSLEHFVIENKIDLTVVGPEIPLCLGIADRLRHHGFLVFGPNKDAAILETSKIFCKNFCVENNIPTAKFKAFKDYEKACEFIKNDNEIIKDGIVVKADGLAAGKGVMICKDRKEALHCVHDLMVNKKFGEAGKEVIVEEFLKGEEISFMIISDGKNIISLESSKDHKKLFDNDMGPNTGGMGAFSPSDLFNDSLKNDIISKFIRPTLEGMQNIGRKFSGVLYAGLIYNRKKLSLLEYNVRFGDPETQPVLFRMDDDIVPILMEIAQGELLTKEIKWSEMQTCCVVMASGGYPSHYEKDKKILGLSEIKDDNNVFVFHAGTKMDGKNILTNGGRVLGVTARGNSLSDASKIAYNAVEKIKFDGAYFRQDIGKK